MEWGYINGSVYFKDGSLRDIYVFNTTVEDWEKWIRFVNDNYPIAFYDRRDSSEYSKIDFIKVSECWNGENEEGVYASINVEGIKIMCYFNGEDEIENDFTPSDVKNVTDHNNLMQYLTNVSKALNKPVLVTKEMQEDEVLISFFEGNVTYSNV